MIQYIFPYWGPLVLEVEMKDELISLLLENGKESREKNLDHSKNLAGVIDNQYYYEDFEEWFCPIFDPHITVYIKTVSNYKEKCFKNMHTVFFTIYLTVSCTLCLDQKS